MPAKKLNVYLRPDEAVSREAEAVADLLEKQGIATFPRQGRLLHATLFMTDYPADSAALVLEAARSVDPAPVPLVTDGLRVTKDGWIFLELLPTPELVATSLAYAQALAPLRDRAQQPPSWMAHYPEKIRSFETWGSPNVGDAFEPHFTLVAKAPPELVVRVFPSEPRLFRPRVSGFSASIALGEADEMGQVSREIAVLSGR